MNKYLVSVDIEGITGVVGKSFSSMSGDNYQLARNYMASDVNAVVDGILAADRNAWILVKDAHGAATNLDLTKLHPKAHIMQGWGEIMSMVCPIDKTFTGVFLVGYHAGGENSNAVLAHTMSSSIHKIKVNGKTFNETGMAAIETGIHNVPIAFISGDDHAIREAKQQLGKNNLTCVTVKKSMGRDAAISMSLSMAAQALTAGANQATLELLADKRKPFILTKPLETEICLYNVGYQISVFAKIAATLKFDKSYSFDKRNFSVTFRSKTTQEMVNKIELLLKILYGVKSAM